jgi:hypothetical protein
MGRLDEVIKLINLYKVTGQAPDPDLIEELGNPPVEWDQLDTRFKKLENWVSKIANAGPGSGETWLKRLDDVKLDGFPILGQVLTFDGKY